MPLIDLAILAVFGLVTHSHFAFQPTPREYIDSAGKKHIFMLPVLHLMIASAVYAILANRLRKNETPRTATSSNGLGFYERFPRHIVCATSRFVNPSPAANDAPPPLLVMVIGWCESFAFHFPNRSPSR